MSLHDCVYSFAVLSSEIPKKYLRKLEDIMTGKDTINLCYLKVLLVGPPGVGKTTTLNRLLKVYKNISAAGDKAKRRSTLLTDCTQVLAFVGEEQTDWLTSNDNRDEESRLVVQYLCDIETEQGLSSETERLSFIDEMIYQPEIVMESESSHTENQKEHHAEKIDQPKSSSQVKANKSEKPANERIDRLRKLIRDGKYSKLINNLGNIWLNINDIGGQPGFLEMLPALSTGPSMYLIFFNLDKELSESYDVTFDRDQTVLNPFPSLHTVESTISQILSSIASAHHISHESTIFQLKNARKIAEKFKAFQEIQPVASLIGTHYDKLLSIDSKKLKIKQTNEGLMRITEKFEKVIVSPGHSVLPTSNSYSTDSSLTFFHVNNQDGEDVDDIAPIRNFMTKIFRSRFKNASFPIQKKLLLLNIILRREFRIAEIKDCFEIGDVLQLDQEEVEFCLWYFDCIGTLMYFSRIPCDEENWFKSHVICAPQVIFDSISQLIVQSMCAVHYEHHVTNFERDELIRRGQFSIDMIEMYITKEVSDKIMKNELIPTKQLIQLLKHVNLLSPIVHKEADGE